MGLISTCWCIYSVFINQYFRQHASPSIPPDDRLARGPSVHHQGQHRRGSGTGHRHRRSHFGPSQGSNVPDSPARKLPRHSLPSPSSSPTGPGVQTAPLSFVRGPLPSSSEQPAAKGPGHHAPSAPLERVVWLPSLTMAFWVVLLVQAGFSLSRNQTWGRVVWLPGRGILAIPWSWGAHSCTRGLLTSRNQTIAC